MNDSMPWPMTDRVLLTVCEALKNPGVRVWRYHGYSLQAGRRGRRHSRHCDSPRVLRCSASRRGWS